MGETAVTTPPPNIEEKESEKMIDDSNITVLVNDIIRKAKHEVDPVGRKSLVEQLIKLNFLAVSSEMLKSREN